MRTSGKITHWNPDKGYGFITPETGAKQVFVHISAFNSRIPPPRLNELVTFIPATDKQGRPSAEQVFRAGETPRIETLPSVKPRPPAARTGDGHSSRSRSDERPRNSSPRARGRSGMGGSALLLVAVLAISAYSYYKLQQPSDVTPAAAIPLSTPVQAAPKFRCDGRTHCSNMTSCEEATWFLQHCPGTQMDGDADGIPCESQWCG